MLLLSRCPADGLHPETLFLPTVPIHDGEAHEKEDFDHELHCQVKHTGLFAMTKWDESQGRAKATCQIGQSKGLLDGDRRLHRRRMNGSFKPQDIILASSWPMRLFISLFLGAWITQAAASPQDVLLISIVDLRPELRCFGADYIHSPHRQTCRGRSDSHPSPCSAPTCGASKLTLLKILNEHFAP